MSDLRIDKRLNLVMPLQTEIGTIFVHSCPIRREIFEKYFLIISKTFAAIYSEGLNIIAGPRIALLMLKQIAINSNAWEGADGVESGLLNEIRRITNVLLPTGNGWSVSMYSDAIAKGLFTQDEMDEIEGEIVFFICASAIHRKADLSTVLDGLKSLWGAQTTPLNCSEYRTSLPTSTVIETLPETVKASSIPS